MDETTSPFVNMMCRQALGVTQTALCKNNSFPRSFQNTRLEVRVVWVSPGISRKGKVGSVASIGLVRSLPCFSAPLFSSTPAPDDGDLREWNSSAGTPHASAKSLELCFVFLGSYLKSKAFRWSFLVVFLYLFTFSCPLPLFVKMQFWEFLEINEKSR